MRREMAVDNLGDVRWEVPGAIVYGRMKEREYGICRRIRDVVRRCRRRNIWF